MSRMDTARNKIVARALGRGTDKVRGLYLDKVVICVILSGNAAEFCAEHNGALHIGSAQVEVSVFKSEFLFDIGIFNYLKRRSFGLRKNLKFGRNHFYLTGGKILANGVFASAADDARNGNAVLGAERIRFVKQFLVRGFLKIYLNDTRAVAKIDEDKSAERASALYPAVDGDCFSDTVGTERSAISGSSVFDLFKFHIVSLF